MLFILFLQSLQDRLKRLMIFLHSTFHLTWGVWTVINYLRYMSHLTESQLPLLKIVGVKLVYSDEALNSSGFWSALFKGHLR